MPEFFNDLHPLKSHEGWLCLDFANLARQFELANTPLDYDTLLGWAQTMGAVAEAEARKLARQAQRQEGQRASVEARLCQLADAVYAIFSCTALGKRVAPDALVPLNTALAEALAHCWLVQHQGAYRWTWDASPEALGRPLWPVARSAAALLTSPELLRVGRCANDACGWLFLDGSKNHSRRWCSMSACGNAAKARRHYRRRKGINRVQMG